MKHPNFFLAGTPKGGTTSLFRYFEEHREIFVPALKEPHYFSNKEVKNSYYKPTIISDEKNYLALYRNATNEKAVGDLSSSYLFHNKSAERIKARYPESKILIVLRNPVERAISHYLMDSSLGFVKRPLIDILKKDTQGDQFYNQYVEVGRYAVGLEVFNQVFDKDQIKIVLSEDLFSETLETLNSIFDFLEVSQIDALSSDRGYNQYKEPRFGVFKYLLKNPAMNRMKELVSPGNRDLLKRILFRSDVSKPEFETEKEILLEKLIKDIEATEKITGIDLSKWKTIKKN